MNEQGQSFESLLAISATRRRAGVLHLRFTHGAQRLLPLLYDVREHSNNSSSVTTTGKIDLVPPLLHLAPSPPAPRPVFPKGR